MRTFGSVVRSARMQKGWSTEELADRLDTYKSYVCGFERGTVNPPAPKLVRKICQVLDLDVMELLILSFVVKAPKEVRKIVIEGSIGLFEAGRKKGVTVLDEGGAACKR